MSSEVKILRRVVIAPQNEQSKHTQSEQSNEQRHDDLLVKQVVQDAGLYADLDDFVVDQINEPINIPIMIADPTFKPHYNGMFVEDFCKRTNQTIHLYGPMGTGKLESIVRAMWSRHVLNCTEAFIIVCSSNEMVQYTYSFVSQHLTGQTSFQGIAISGPPADSNLIFNGQLLICTYDAVAKLKRSNIAAAGLVTLFFFDAEMICVPSQQQYYQNKNERGFTAKRKVHTNGAIVADPPSIHNLYCDAYSNFPGCRIVFVSNQRVQSIEKFVSSSDKIVQYGQEVPAGALQNFHHFIASGSMTDRELYLLQLLANYQQVPQIMICARLDRFYQLETLFQANGVQAVFLSQYNLNSTHVADFCIYGRCHILVVSDRHSRLPFSSSTDTGERLVINFDAPTLTSYMSSCVRVSQFNRCHVFTLLDNRSQFSAQVESRLGYSPTERVIIQ